jgi:hypothetical protein
LSSATHHIFFPPRFEIVVQEQDPNGFSSHAWNQSPLHGFFRHQAHGPSGATFGRIAANHSDNSLLLAVLQQRGRAGPLFLIERAFEAILLVAVTDLANRLCRQWNHPGDTRRADTLGQLQQSHRPEDYPHCCTPLASAVSSTPFDLSW